MRNRLILPLLLVLATPLAGYSMHIAEGFLPARWCVAWTAVFIPFLAWGYISLKKKLALNARSKMLYAVVGAFVFVLSSLKLPSVAGSSSHLTGVAIGAILFGASSMSVIGLIVLLFQALLLAHGGLTTLGANCFSMVVVGSFVAVWVFKALKRINLPLSVTIFISAVLSDLSIYLCTSLQLALAFQGGENTVLQNVAKFSAIFAVTQVPLAVIEGVLSVLFFNLILRYNAGEIELLNPSFKQK